MLMNWQEDRVVLICDLWHPEVDLEKHVRPSLAPAQREALAAAEAGRHLPVQLRRVYSTGASVVRRGD